MEMSDQEKAYFHGIELDADQDQDAGSPQGEGQVLPGEPEGGEAVAERAPTEHEDRLVPLAALREEREKRQRLQAEVQRQREILDHLTRAELSRQPQAPAKQEQEQEDPLSVMIRSEAEKLVQPLARKVQEREQQEAFNSRLAATEAGARRRYQDYDRIVGVVSTEAMRRAQEGDAGLARVLLSSPDPAEMAYTLGKRWEFEAMQRGQSVGGSTGSKTPPQMPRGASVPGGGGTSGFDLEGYLNLSGDEYARLPREVRQEIDKRMRSIG